MVPAFHVAGALGERLEDEELGDRQPHLLAAPSAEMARRIEHQVAARYRLPVFVLAVQVLGQALAPQQDPDPLEQQALGEWLGNVIVGAHAQAQHLIHLVILGGQKDHGKARILTQAAQQLHTVHPRHLDVEYGQIDRLSG